MQGTGRRAMRAPVVGARAAGFGKLLRFALWLAVAGCTTDGVGPPLTQVALNAPSIAFESVDGPPPPVFERLVRELATEAENHQLVVVSRTSPAAFRVRCYLAAAIVKGRAHFDWVWDVYDAQGRRALRIAGEESGGSVRAGEVWDVLDEATLNRIARASIDQLVSFLGTPGTPQVRAAFAEEAGKGPR